MPNSVATYAVLHLQECNTETDGKCLGFPWIKLCMSGFLCPIPSCMQFHPLLLIKLSELINNTDSPVVIQHVTASLTGKREICFVIRLSFEIGCWFNPCLPLEGAYHYWYSSVLLLFIVFKWFLFTISFTLFLF